MRQMVKRHELDKASHRHGLAVQHDCGGYRLVKGTEYVFPSSGICPTATKRECMLFLEGCEFSRRIKT